MHIPQIMATIAFLNFMPSRAAKSAPVHAPVPGSGMPTKIISPQNSPFSSRSFLERVLDSIVLTKGRKELGGFKPGKYRNYKPKNKGYRYKIAEHTNAERL